MKKPNYQVYIRNDWPLPFVQPWAFGPTNLARPPFQWDLILVANLGDKYAWCYHEKSVLALGHAIDRHLAKPENLKKFTKLAKQTEKENRDFSEYVSKIALEKKSIRELSDLLKHWYEIHSRFTTRFMPIDATDETLESDIRLAISNFTPVIRRGGTSDDRAKFQITNKDFSCLLTPDTPSYVQNEHREFCALVKKFEKNINTPAAQTAIAKHADKWWWTVMGWGQHHPLDKKALEKNILKIKNIPELLGSQKKDAQNRHKTLTLKRELLKTLPRGIKNLLDAFEVLAEMHDTRKEIQMRMMNAGILVTRQLLKKSRIPVEFRNFILVEEYLALAKGLKPPLQELKNRKKAYWCEFRPGKKIVMLSGKKALAKIKQSKIGAPASASDSALIKGIPASPGIATGKARVGLKAQDIIRTIQKGEILVTSQTTPEFAPAMKKAAAIVTDEGGITSHAAIVSRELGIPCVIGTKTATHIIRTGEMIEVDANKGVVKKLT